MRSYEIDRFRAGSDDGTHETTIIVEQEMIPAGHRENPTAMIAGLKVARTVDGFLCNYVSDGVFEIVNDPFNLGRIVKRLKDRPAP